MSSAAAPCRCRAASRRADGLAARSVVEVARVQPDVELRDVEAEQLDHALEASDAAVGDAAPAVARSGSRRIRRRSASSVCGVCVAVVAEPPPHERELAPVRLELVARADLVGVVRAAPLVAAQRRFELGRHGDQRARRRDLDRERAYLGAVARRARARGARASASSIDAGPAAGLPSMSPPIHEPNASGGWRAGQRARAIRCSRSVAADIRLCSKNQSAVPDLVRDAQAVVPHLVGLPEQRHLLGDPLLGLEPLDRRDARVVEQRAAARDRGCARAARCAASSRSGARSGRAGSSPRRAPQLVAGDGRELLERIFERLARDAAVVRVLAPPAQPMVLLGEVRELEVEAERAQDERLRSRRRAGRVDGADGAPSRRAERASRRICSTSSRSQGPSCSTSTVPRIVPSKRTSRRSGAAVSRHGLQPLRVRARAPRGGVRVGRRSSSRATRDRLTEGRAPVTTSTTRAPALDLAAADRLDERAERGAAGEVGVTPGALGEQRGVR